MHKIEKISELNDFILSLEYKIVSLPSNLIIGVELEEKDYIAALKEFEQFIPAEQLNSDVFTYQIMSFKCLISKKKKVLTQYEIDNP
jgi:hypothetical protein